MRKKHTIPRKITITGQNNSWLPEILPRYHMKTHRKPLLRAAPALGGEVDYKPVPTWELLPLPTSLSYFPSNSSSPQCSLGILPVHFARERSLTFDTVVTGTGDLHLHTAAPYQPGGTQHTPVTPVRNCIQEDLKFEASQTPNTKQHSTLDGMSSVGLPRTPMHGHTHTHMHTHTV